MASLGLHAETIVKELGSEVRPIPPAYRIELPVELDGLEEVLLREWVEYLSPQLGFQVDLSFLPSSNLSHNL